MIHIWGGRARQSLRRWDLVGSRKSEPESQGNALDKEIVKAKRYFWEFVHFSHLETNLKSVSHILGSVPIKACHIPMNLQSEDMCCLCLGLIFQTSQSKLVTSQWICEIRKPLRYVFTACIVNDHRWQLQSIHFVSKSCDLHCQKRTP